MIHAPLRVEMLGGFQVVVAETAMTRFRTRQTGSLFAYLIIHRGQRLPRELLAEMFWPDAANLEKARASLSVAISSLRSQFETKGGQVLLVDARSLGVRAEVVHSDVVAFEQALDRIDGDDTPATIEALRQALSLFRGTFLPGYYEDWVLAEQARLRDRFVTAVRRLGNHFEAEGDVDEAIYWRRQELRHFPDMVGVLENLIQLLTEEDRLKEAAELYHESARHWSEAELGALPESVTRRAQAALTLHPKPSPRPRVVRTPQPPAPTPPVPEQPRPVLSPVSLPLEITRFVGRETELAKIRDFVDTGQGRLLTLIGPGGVGKTRLALEAAYQLHQAGGSAHFIPLQNAHTEQDFLRAVAESLQVRLPAGADADPLETICYLLNQQQKPVLVLDNLEQLQGTPATLCLGRLLQRVPQLCCLATSQTRVAIPGERLFPIKPLPVPSPQAILAGSKDPEAFEATWPSIALFVDRAREGHPDFHLHVHNLVTIAEIVRLLEGLPLALLLAAARIQVSAPSEILEGITQRFHFLTTHRHVLVARHRSLHASISWSFDLLRPELQRFFIQLTVFRGSFGIRDVEAVLQTPLALDFLAELCDSSFLTTKVNDQHVRFEMLESLRLFGDQQWDSQEREALRQRHALHFASLADQARSHWRTDQEPIWMERLQNDLENLRASMQWSLEGETPEYLNAAYQLGSGLSRFWWINIYHKEGRNFLEKIIHSEEMTSYISELQYIKLNIGLISQLMMINDKRKAKILIKILLDKSTDSYFEEESSVLLANLGAIEMEDMNINEGILCFGKAMSIFKKRKDHIRLLFVYHNIVIGLIHNNMIKNALIYSYREFLLAVKIGYSARVSTSIQSIADCVMFLPGNEISLRLYAYAMRGCLDSRNFLEVVGILLCYYLLMYNKSKELEYLSRIIYIHNFKNLSGLSRGTVSDSFMKKHNIIVYSVGVGSLDEAKTNILTWAEEITRDVDEISNAQIRNIVKSCVRLL